MKKIDKTGRRYGMLTVIRESEHGTYECLCDCGETCFVSAKHLVENGTKSCGCLVSKNARDRNYKHGESRTRLYSLWVGIKKRCNYPNKHTRAVYFDRGITICNEWETYEAFRNWALANGFDENARRGECTIDRIDNEKGYSPENCRFVTQTENVRNKRNTRRFLFHGKMLTTGEMSEITGTSTDLIRFRLRHGWNAEDAAEKPPRIMHYKDGTTNYGNVIERGTE